MGNEFSDLTGKIVSHQHNFWSMDRWFRAFVKGSNERYGQDFLTIINITSALGQLSRDRSIADPADIESRLEWPARRIGEVLAEAKAKGWVCDLSWDKSTRVLEFRLSFPGN